MKVQFFCLSLIMMATYSALSQNVVLPKPQKSGGMPLMEALAQRSTERSFSSKELTVQQLSNLLWASFGVNRPDGKRTAPSARNFQETDLFVLTKVAVYTYDAKSNQLIQVANEDIRHLAGSQDFIKDAPIQLVLVADLSKIQGNKREDKLQTAHIDAGYISQNIYLWCASEGLGTGARGMIDRPTLGPRLKLNANQEIIIAHSVGYKK